VISTRRSVSGSMCWLTCWCWRHLGIYNFCEGMTNVESAAVAGDNYNLRSVLLADGTGAVVGAALGSRVLPGRGGAVVYRPDPRRSGWLGGQPWHRARLPRGRSSLPGVFLREHARARRDTRRARPGGCRDSRTSHSRSQQMSPGQYAQHTPTLSKGRVGVCCRRPSPSEALPRTA
jgi:hypothetical protein